MDTKGRVHTCCAAVPNSWHVMGVTQGAGLSLKWFRDNFCAAEKQTASLMGVDEYYLMDKEAEQVPVGANRLLYLPYLMGERTPHLDPNARGVFFGLSAMHTKRDMLRAVLEGVTYSLRDCVEVFREMGISVDDMMACGGGGTIVRSRLWLPRKGRLWAWQFWLLWVPAFMAVCRKHAMPLSRPTRHRIRRQKMFRYMNPTTSCIGRSIRH